MSTNRKKTKDKIVETTLGLIDFPKSSLIRMSDIAEGASISRQALYKYFPTRADLFIYILQFIEEGHGFSNKLVNDQNFSSKEKLKSFINYWGEYNQVTYSVISEIKMIKDMDKKAMSILKMKNRFFTEKCRLMIQVLKNDDLLTSNFSYDESVDILCNLVSEDNWAYFYKTCGWSQSAYLKRTQEIVGYLLIGKQIKSSWSIGGY